MIDRDLRNPTSFFRTKDGARLALYEAGLDDGPVIVLSNGLGGMASAWRYVFEALKDEYRIVSWDYRGLYNSDASPSQEGFPIDCHVQDLKDLLDHLGIERAAFMGWSMGVQVNYEFAHEHPEYVHSVMAISGTTGNPFKTLLKTSMLGSAAPLVAAALRGTAPFASILAPILSTGRSFLPVLQKIGLIGPEICEDVADEQFRSYVTLNYKNYAGILEGLDAHDTSEYLHDLKMPVLIVAGEKDLLTPVACSEKMSEMLPNARLVVLQNASHFAPIETPQELNILILEFLAQLGGSKSVLAQSV